MTTADNQQSRYEVRFDWGPAGLSAIADGAGVIILVQGIADGHQISAAVESLGREPADTAIVDAAHASGARVVAASLRNRTAVAQHVLQHQVQRGERVRVALVAETSLGADSHQDAVGSGFAVDTLFAAGAVIDALAAVGIDYSSPEAAAASAAFTGLERAVGHLYTASTAGQRLIASGKRDAVVAAGQVDASELVPVLGDDGYWAVG
ncbi:2-phosphosulfolactate phosphatase [Paramicrobacterium chengjingii]|uniref:2-phosphosulfolactate phosphatase n=1 Tax=Paramicrobacterium chengjingii TaxID=2769067 RepID=UPI00142220E3|nr:2-phosphosulfolactate phosphatase [Microbacterium chengjingii]